MSFSQKIMGQGYPLGRVAGIDIYVNKGWLWLCAFILFSFLHSGAVLASLTVGILYVLGLSFSILAHEYGHALCARLFGIQTSDITLHLLGGVARLESNAKRASHEFFIAAAGPAVSLLLWPIFDSLALSTGLPVLALLGRLNLILALFNLLPGFPLDGGRIVKALVWGVSDHEKLGSRWAGYGGRGVAYLLFALAFFLLTGGNLPNALLLGFLGYSIHELAGHEIRNNQGRSSSQAHNQGGFRFEQFTWSHPESEPRQRAPRDSDHGSSGSTADEFGEVIRLPDGREVFIPKKRPDETP